jgi:hypothetical protein
MTVITIAGSQTVMKTFCILIGSSSRIGHSGRASQKPSTKYGTIAAHLLRDVLLERANPLLSLYNPATFA